jgi:hypothetical protein
MQPGTLPRPTLIFLITGWVLSSSYRFWREYDSEAIALIKVVTESQGIGSSIVRILSSFAQPREGQDQKPDPHPIPKGMSHVAQEFWSTARDGRMAEATRKLWTAKVLVRAGFARASWLQ